MLEYLNIGEIVNTHGVRGDIKVLPMTDDVRRYEDLEWFYIDKKGTLDKVYIDGIKYVNKFVVIKLRDVRTKEEAEKLKGYFIKINRTDAIKLPEGAFFICDIIGCSVFDEKLDKDLGEIVDIIQTGSNDVYIVKNKDLKEILVPALKTVVKNISIEDKMIRVVLPEGLIEDDL